jgi:hypothetical protein
MGFFRSIFKSNEVRLAKELALIRSNIATRNNLTLSEIHSLVMTAIMHFKEMEGVDTIPPGLDQLKDELMAHHCQRQKEKQSFDIMGNDVIQKRINLSQEQEEMIANMQNIKEEIPKCDLELQKKSQKESEVMQRKKDLEVQVKAIETRRQKEREAITVLDKLNPERAAIVIAKRQPRHTVLKTPDSPIRNRYTFHEKAQNQEALLPQTPFTCAKEVEISELSGHFDKVNSHFGFS